MRTPPGGRKLEKKAKEQSAMGITSKTRKKKKIAKSNSAERQERRHKGFRRMVKRIERRGGVQTKAKNTKKEVVRRGRYTRGGSCAKGLLEKEEKLFFFVQMRNHISQ